MRRRTVGKFDSGETFKIDDEWNTEETRHKMLERSWTGYTEFYVDNGHEDDDDQEGRPEQIILRNPRDKERKNFEDAREKLVRFEGSKNKSRPEGPRAA